MKDLFLLNPNYNKDDADYLIKNYQIDADMARLFSSRGVTKQNAERYFNFDEKNIYEPSLMKNMTTAADIVSKTMKEGGKILIYGDYDADGLTASAILKLFFNNNGTECDVVIPTRDEGYGMHIENIYDAFSKKQYDLIITVDCGISNKAEIDILQKEISAGIIVTDHHEIPKNIPDCICVNPKMGYPYAYLAGAGVALKLVQAVGGYNQSKNYFDLATVGTIADMMPLIDENRDIVKIGLKHFNHKGLKRLAEISKCSKPYTANDIALKIAPKINAAGRIGDPYLALQVLLMQNFVDDAAIQELLRANEERRFLVDDVVTKAESMLSDKQFMQDGLIFLYDDGWKNGVLGIAANRFKETYGIPAIFMTRDGENYVGSARGVDDVNLYELFDSVSEILVKFGGHKASVGFTVKSENLQILKNQLVNALKSVERSDCAVNYYDLEFDNKYLVKENFNKLEMLQPLLPNDKIVFHTVDFAKIATLFGSEKNHLKVTLNNGLELKGFYRFAVYYDALNAGGECEMLFNLEYDSYSKRVVGVINNIRLKNSLRFEELYTQNLLTRLNKRKSDLIDAKKVEKLLKKVGTLAVFASYQEFSVATEFFDFSAYRIFFFSQNVFADNAVLISPANEESFRRYSNVIVFGEYGGFCPTYFAPHSLFQIESKLPSCLNLRLDRAICAAVYKALSENVKAVDLRTLFMKLRLGDVNYAQFIAAVKVFEELNLLKFTKPFSYEILKTDKTDLANSDTFKLFNKVD